VSRYATDSGAVNWKPPRQAHIIHKRVVGTIEFDCRKFHARSPDYFGELERVWIEEASNC
jgi:hypothetical protein